LANFECRTTSCWVFVVFLAMMIGVLILLPIQFFCDALSLFKLGFSWGGPISLVMLYDLKDMRTLEHTHLQQGLLVRFCIGLEHPADLIQDIENALKQLNNHHKKIE
jgi:cysteine-S-conjugate beta-lyase